MTPAEIVSTLADLEKHPGWALVTDRYSQDVRQVVTEALDQATDDQLTLKLKHAHGLLVETHPEKLRAKIQAHHRAIALKEARAVMGATDGNP